jgi:predicted ATPase/class 3 adenylate cyclase
MDTLLFTDIEGSTRLWEEHAEAMAKALSRHDELLTGAIGSSNGRVLKHTGDGLIAVFPEPVSSIQAAIQAQVAMAQEEWGETGPIRIRIGIHAGDTEHRDGDQFGPVMNRAARIMAAGHGGQILLSQAVAANSELPAGASLIDLGMHRLKDLTAPERLFQLDSHGLASDFPPPRTLDSRPNNLPLQASEFLGREDDIAAVRLMLNSPSTRLITLAGPGGAGKTRLALQVAVEQADYCEDGVFFVDLAATSTLDEAFEAIVRALGLPYNGGGDLIKFLTARLRHKRMLLVLDNFEQVTVAATGVVDLLQGTEELKVLVTSRQTLRVRGERVYPVPPLGLPHPDNPPEDIAMSEAVMLFADRARSVMPDFTVTAENASAVAHIVLRLDGLPLAIELAAARISVFSPQELLDRLQGQLDVLGSGGRDLPDRQRTLWSAIRWSYDLLDASERSVFEAMSVFASADLKALESVIGTPDVVDSVASLVDKSLIRVPESGSTRRFSMLLMVREFALDRLEQDPGRLHELRDSHARFFARRATDIVQLLEAERDRALEVAESEAGNLAGAWRFLVDKGDVDTALSMLNDLWVIYEAKGWYRAGADAATDALGMVEGSGRPAEEVMLRTARARATMTISGYTPEVEAEFRKALELSGTTEGTEARASILRSLATLIMNVARFEETVEYGEQLLEIGKATNNDRLVVEGLYVKGVSLAFSGQIQEGVRLMDQAIALQDPRAHHSTRYGFGPNTGVVALVASGMLSWLYGSPVQAVDRLERGLALAERMRHPYSIAFALYHNGFLCFLRSRFEEAVNYARRLGDVARTGDYVVWQTLATVLEGAVTAFIGEPERGREMIDTGLDLYQGTVAPPVFWPFLLALRALVYARCGREDEAEAIADEAVEIGSPQRADNPELRMFRAEVRMLNGDLQGAEEGFSDAIDVASTLGLRMLELQSLVGLVTVRRQLGVTPDGSEQLAAVYDSFADGLDEVSLASARVLLRR